MAKILIILGLILVLAGLLMQFLPGEGLPRLPGDIYIKRENYSFYFPLGWCIAISVIVSLVIWVTSK
jgi:hypothetical protein